MDVIIEQNGPSRRNTIQIRAKINLTIELN